MTLLILGLMLFLGIHSSRMVGDGARSRFIAQRGAGAWKGLYSVVSALGLIAIVWGYAIARTEPVVLWARVPGMNHLAALLTLMAFILMVATYVPGNAFKARLHHPMLLSVVFWSLAHLLAKNTLAAELMFGSFLIWALLCFRSARQRDLAESTVAVSGRLAATWVTLVVGIAVWAVFAIWLHGAWLGVRPLG